MRRPLSRRRIMKMLAALGLVASAAACQRGRRPMARVLLSLFAERHGVHGTRIPAALAGGRADSRILQEFMAKMARRDVSPTGRIDNMLKDLETVQAAALATRIPLPVTSLIADLHRMLVAAGFGVLDGAEYVRLFNMAADRPK